MELSAWHMWWKRRGGADIRRVLMDEWDPVGVAGISEATGEYDAYVGAVGQKLREGATAEEIGAYLTDISENWIGLGPSPRRRAQERAVADRLVAWYRDEMAAAKRS